MFGIAVDDAEIEALVREQADLLDDNVDETLVAAARIGRFESLREDMRLRNALDRVVAEVKRIPPELADARERFGRPTRKSRRPRRNSGPRIVSEAAKLRAH